MKFDINNYKKQFINEASETPNKLKEPAELNAQVKEFIRSGGKIERVPFGISTAVYRNLRQHQKIRRG